MSEPHIERIKEDLTKCATVQEVLAIAQTEYFLLEQARNEPNKSTYYQCLITFTKSLTLALMELAKRSENSRSPRLRALHTAYRIYEEEAKKGKSGFALDDIRQKWIFNVGQQYLNTLEGAKPSKHNRASWNRTKLAITQKAIEMQISSCRNN